MATATEDDGAARARTLHFVIPAYNEEASIADLLDRIAEICRDEALPFDVLVVDDGSADRTGEISREKAADMPIQVVRNDPNRGLGYTIGRGLRIASGLAKPDDILVTMDADLTQDPAYVPAMLAAIDTGADVAVASRYRHGSSVEGLSVFRRVLSYGASGFVTLMRPIHGLRDYSCGFRAYRAEVIQWGFGRFGDDFVSETGFGCMVEIAERLRERATFAEVPFVLHYEAKRKRSEIKIVPTMRAYVRVIRRIRADARRAAR